jgi:antitoxin component of MazEF toxin-antitoxin module
MGTRKVGKKGGSLITAIPPDLVKDMDLKVGDEILFYRNLETGNVCIENQRRINDEYFSSDKEKKSK